MSPSRLLAPFAMLCLLALHSTYAEAQGPDAPASREGGLKLKPVTTIAATATGLIEGKVTDELGTPLDGAVISALGGTTAFAVSDKTGQYSLKQLPPGPYLVRVHLAGFFAARSTMVNVRPSGRSASSFMLHREDGEGAPRISEASVAGAPNDDGKPDDRNESELAWRLRHLKRGVLRDTDMLAGVPRDDDWFLQDSFEFLGHAVETSARAATGFFSDLPFGSLGGQVNLLTTGAFDTPVQLLNLDHTSSVAFFKVGAPVGTHGDWNVRAAMNQTDLSSWMLAGSYVVKAQIPHRYQFGMAYSVQRYEGGNTAALGSVSDTARNVGSVFAFDEWQVSRYISVGYGANYASYDYMEGSGLFSPRLSTTLSLTPSWRLRGSASRDVSAPGAEEFIPPMSAEYLPPQRTFSPIAKGAELRTQEFQNYDVGLERVLNRAAISVRAFEQRIDNQTVTVFGLRQPDSAPSALGHYYVGSAGDAEIHGLGVTFTHAFADNVHGSVDYSMSTAEWTGRSEPIEYAVLTRWVPSAVRPRRENIHDVTTSLDAVVPYSATHVVVLYKLNNAFAANAKSSDAGFGSRFDLRVTQALPFMNFGASQWEMLVGVRNLFHESLANTSVYDELLVVRPPKRLVGGLTVKF